MPDIAVTADGLAITEADVKQRSLMFGTASSVAPAMPVTVLRYDKARELFTGAGQDLDGLTARAKAGTIEPVSIPCRASHSQSP